MLLYFITVFRRKRIAAGGLSKIGFSALKPIFDSVEEINNRCAQLLFGVLIIV